MDKILEQARETSVIEDADVVVIGGGPGGITAAVAAARQGCKTILIERYGFMGGLATAGLMGPIFGYTHYNGDGKLQLGSIPVEIVRRLQAIGGAPADDVIDWRAVQFDPELFKHIADAIVLESGVKVLLHSYVVDAVVKNKKIQAIIVESKSGRAAITGKTFIDATGDGDIAKFCNCPYTQGRAADGATQSMGTKFRIGGVTEEALHPTPEDKKKVCQAIDAGKIPAYHVFWGEISEQGVTLRNTEITPTVTRARGFGTNVYDLTKAEIKTRKDTLEIVDFYRRNIPGYQNCYLIDTPMTIGVRETRQVIGDYVLTGHDVLEYRKFDDTIARGNWFLDIHCPLGLYNSASNLCSKKCTIQPDCLMKRKHRDQLYDTLNAPVLDDPSQMYNDIPYRCLVPQGIDNLLISGRCISADHGGMASIRVIATCFAIGEAAGIAAYLGLKSGAIPRDIPVGSIQESLRKAGVPL
ncbi:MAG: FAD-dependent oxidoreductase [Planctomycetes bacterium]|jgi:ribulose 1,5-bisphosphate synthetase/thiazole synthase|nr:FAD-dependent oxidoreductase [Planctomycetota bacterium]